MRLHGWLRLRKENEGAEAFIHGTYVHGTYREFWACVASPLVYAVYTHDGRKAVGVVEKKKTAACKRTKLIRIVFSLKVTCLF